MSEALALVRGVPFYDPAPGAYAWAHIGKQIASDLTNRIISAALALADLAIVAGDHQLAGWAARQGLLVSPTDIALNRQTLAAAHQARPSRLDQAWRELDDRYTAALDTPPDELRDYYRRLKGS